MISTNDIQNYIDELTKASDARFAEHFAKSKPDVFSFRIGKRYAKVIKTTWGGEGQRSVHCFIDLETGNLLKAAGWKKPAKGIRGNIFNESKPFHGGDFYIR